MCLPWAAVLLLALALLSGCNPAGEETGENGGGAATTADSSADGTGPGETAEEDKPLLPPTDWPAFLSVYPGSDVKQSEAVEGEFGTGIEAELYSGAGLDEIIEFYEHSMEEQGFYLWETTVSPIERYHRYIAPNYLIQVAAVRETDVTRIILDAQPAEPMEGGNPPHKLTWLDLNKLPDDFPTELLPMDGMQEITSTIQTADGKLEVLDYLSSSTMDELDAFYTDYYASRGWKKEERSRSDKAINLQFFKDGMQITIGIGTYIDGQVSASLVYEPELPAQ